MRTLAAIAALMLGPCRVEDSTSVDDSSALRDSFRQLKPLPECEHPLEIVDPKVAALRAHRAIASLSASCSPGTPRVCKQTLLKRACELEADALILDEHASSGGQWQDPASRIKAMNAKAIRWTE